MNDELVVEIRGPVGILTVNRVERRNALRRDLWVRFGELVKELDARDDLRVIVARGAGDQAFVSGADISEFDRFMKDMESAREYGEAAEATCRACETARRPIIAWIAGACFGGGLSLALATDIRIAADNAVFCIPAAKLGLPYEPEALRRVVTNLGASVARDLLLTARVVKADEALRMGIVHALVPTSSLEEEGLRWAESMARLAPLSNTYTKKAVAQLSAHGLADETVRAAMACFDSEDYEEGRRAFHEKRSPRFVGR